MSGAALSPRRPPWVVWAPSRPSRPRAGRSRLAVAALRAHRGQPLGQRHLELLGWPRAVVEALEGDPAQARAQGALDAAQVVLLLGGDEYERVALGLGARGAA